MPAQPTLRDYRPTDRNDAVAIAARAFSIDPLFDFFAKDLLHQHKMLPGLMAAYIDDVDHHGRAWIVEDAGRPKAYAGWLPPSALPKTSKRELRGVGGIVRAIPHARNVVAAGRLFAEVEKTHPKEPHWYLAVLVADPTVQGRGFGTLAIGAGLAKADEEGLPCYLETQKEENVAWYARQGFEPHHTIALPGVPNVWCLWREPCERRPLET